MPGSFSKSSAEAVLMLIRDSDLESLAEFIAVDASDSRVAAFAPKVSGLYERFTQPATSQHRTTVSVTHRQAHGRVRVVPATPCFTDASY
jgi:hypothetical protein